MTIQLSENAQKAFAKFKQEIESLITNKYPLVAIQCQTFNHEAFIRDTLEGFVMQHTNFPFVAIVHDDASTDGTAAIILEYAEKYPDIIFPIIETENQYSKKNGSLSKIIYDALAATGAKYIAKCEGDDYWTDPLKLQKQVDFLESHPDYVMCTHNYREYFQNEGKFGDAFNLPSQDYTLNSYINFKEWIYLTLTMVYRASAFDLDEFLQYSERRDTVFIYYLLKKGYGRYLNEDMGVYRRHGNGIWTDMIWNVHKSYRIDLKVRKAIYNVEQDKLSSEFLMNRAISTVYKKKFLIRHFNKIISIIPLYLKQNGIRKTIHVLFKRFV